MVAWYLLTVLGGACVAGGGDWGLPAVSRIGTRVPDLQRNPQHAAERGRGVAAAEHRLTPNSTHSERRERLWFKSVPWEIWPHCLVDYTHDIWVAVAANGGKRFGEQHMEMFPESNPQWFLSVFIFVTKFFLFFFQIKLFWFPWETKLFYFLFFYFFYSWWKMWIHFYCRQAEMNPRSKRQALNPISPSLRV